MGREGIIAKTGGGEVVTNGGCLLLVELRPSSQSLDQLVLTFFSFGEYHGGYGGGEGGDEFDVFGIGEAGCR